MQHITEIQTDLFVKHCNEFVIWWTQNYIQEEKWKHTTKTKLWQKSILMTNSFWLLNHITWPFGLIISPRNLIFLGTYIIETRIISYIDFIVSYDSAENRYCAISFKKCFCHGEWHLIIFIKSDLNFVMNVNIDLNVSPCNVWFTRERLVAHVHIIIQWMIFITRIFRCMWLVKHNFSRLDSGKQYV